MDTKEVKKSQKAKVVSKSGNKSIVCQIDYKVRHPQYGKYIRRRTKMGVHDPQNLAGVGDVVEITECRPISKTKSWRLINVIQKAAVVEE